MPDASLLRGSTFPTCPAVSVMARKPPPHIGKLEKEKAVFTEERRRRTGLPLLVQDHVAGSSWARVIIVEYGTYCCPREVWTYPAIHAMQRDHPDQVALVYRHYPLVTTYPSAFLAAEAAEAAAGKAAFG